MPSDHQRKCPLVHLITAPEPVGWHVVEIRPSIGGGETTLWRATIECYDENVTMTMAEAYPQVARAELARYAQADAKEGEALVDCVTVRARRRVEQEPRNSPAVPIG